MPKKKDKNKNSNTTQTRTPRPRPKVDFTIDKLNYRNTELLETFVTGHGRILPRKYTGLPARYQRRMANAIKQARQLLLMK
ncbi:MAG: 30S ribosomal protein S18 [Verrucomicrobiota bacterium]|nr:30S ribosomal protein S18 [Verrucomicrobiota bacterium]|tara:strand:+ start:55 stop:297 length:243 start_codon:yes stop_codon:yes gene_type:complete